jgi:transketolase N-terminal domain/subunit
MATHWNIEKNGGRLRMDVLDLVLQARAATSRQFVRGRLLTALYFDMMNVRPQEPHWRSGPLCIEQGPRGDGSVCRFGAEGLFPHGGTDAAARRFHSAGATSPESPGVDITPGPLGMGLCSAVGLACAPGC